MNPPSINASLHGGLPLQPLEAPIAPSPTTKGSRNFFLEMDPLLSLSILFSCGMVILRVIHTGRITYLSLVWNLFLAYIPYFISQYLARRAGNPLPKWSFVALVLTWLLFVPNTFYIITDLFHLNGHYQRREGMQWFDLVLIFSFAWNGLLLGILSLRQMEKILLPLLAPLNRIFFLYPVMWLIALGVYIGRYLRYNSWDVLTDPLDLLGDLSDLTLHPLRNHDAWDMIFCFSIFLTLMYLMMKKISWALT
jgi:uncharacterized membrane protein